MNTLVCDFHAHSLEDPKDTIHHTARQLIDRYAESGFDVVALTLHSRVYAPASLVAYAQKKGLLFIPGVEARITDIPGDAHGRDVVVLGITEREHRGLKTFDDLRRLRTAHERAAKPLLVFAPHPYYPGKSSLQDMLERNLDCFDAIEHSHFYPRGFNRFNKRAVAFAKAHALPVVGTGDVHHLSQIGHTCTLVHAAKTLPAVFAAVRHGRCLAKTRPLSLTTFVKTALYMTFVTSQKRRMQAREGKRRK